MRLLLDSHIFLWAKAWPEKLSEDARAVIADPRNDVLVSVASAWELWIKHAKKPLAPMLDAGPSGFLTAVTESGMRLLGIDLAHAAAAATLPLHHKDPFDRMLVAQAMVEQLTLVTVDSDLARYRNVQLLAG